jgi:membrane associated rhomboid family serine protease
MLALGAWVATQFIMLLLPAGQIAWWAHVGGIAAGFVLVIVLRRPGVALFRPAPRAKS